MDNNDDGIEVEVSGLRSFSYIQQGRRKQVPSPLPHLVSIMLSPIWASSMEQVPAKHRSEDVRKDEILQAHVQSSLDSLDSIAVQRCTSSTHGPEHPATWDTEERQDVTHWGTSPWAPAVSNSARKTVNSTVNSTKVRRGCISQICASVVH